MTYDIEYIPGNGPDFVAFINKQKLNKCARWESIDGNFRWIVRREDGTEYIARPISAKK